MSLGAWGSVSLLLLWAPLKNLSASGQTSCVGSQQTPQACLCPQVSNGSSLGFFSKSFSFFPSLCLPAIEQGLLGAPGPWRDRQGAPVPHNIQDSTPTCLRANSHLLCFCNLLIPWLFLPSSPGNFCPPGGRIFLVVLPYHTCRFKLGPLP